MSEHGETVAESMMADFAEAAQNVDRLAKMFRFRRKIYTMADMEKLRREYFPAFYKRLDRTGLAISSLPNRVEVEKMDLQIARDIGRHDPFELQARLAFDPLDRDEELWVFADGYVLEARPESEDGDWTANERAALNARLGDLAHAWDSLFEEVSKYAPDLVAVREAKASFETMFTVYSRMVLCEASDADAARYAEMHAAFIDGLKRLCKALAAHIVIDGDKLDYGEVSRIELGRYSFEDVYVDSEGCFGYERAGRLFYIKDNGMKHPYVNKYLLAFDEERLEAVRQLELQYNMFKRLMIEGRQEEALEHLPVEDAECEMGGVVMKIRKAIEDLKIFARDSVDKYGTIRDEAFQQFKDGASGTILGESFDAMRADWYRNLAYVGGTESMFAVIREPLYFLNECWDNLFRWLVRDMKCKFFERAWDMWTRYKNYCCNAGYSRPWEGVEDPAVAAKTDSFAQKMWEAFDDLSEKRLPRYSTEPIDVGSIARDIRMLLEDGNPFLNPTAESRLGVCLEKLNLIARACMQRQQWGMFGNVPFIRMTVMMAEIEDLEVYKDDGMELAVKWASLRNTMDAYLSLLSAQIQCRKIRVFQDWLSSLRKITIDMCDSSIKVSVNPEVVSGFREMCRDVAISICIPDQIDGLREEYAGNIGWMCEDDDYLELRKPADTKKKSKAAALAALAREPSPFFANKTETKLKPKIEETAEYVVPTITDEQILELGADRRVVDYLNGDPIACWRYPYYEFLCIRKEYIQAGFPVLKEAEEHLVAFLVTSLDEYSHEFASRFEGEELEYQIERHDSYKQKYIYDVYGWMRNKLAEKEGAKVAAENEQKRLDHEEALLAEGRKQGVQSIVGLLGVDGKMRVIVDGCSEKGRAELTRIVNTKKPERNFFSDPNLSALFDVHPNSIANWRKKKGSPEGFLDAFEKKNYGAMQKAADKYKANRGRADAMNTKCLERGISEEQIYKQGGNRSRGWSETPQ